VNDSLNTHIRSFILKKFPLAKKRQLKDSDSLLESGILDSQGVLEIVSFLEEELSVPVEDNDLLPENFQTIDRIVAFVQSKSMSRSAGTA
jgi:acyl carrier protein